MPAATRPVPQPSVPQPTGTSSNAGAGAPLDPIVQQAVTNLPSTTVQGAFALHEQNLQPYNGQPSQSTASWNTTTPSQQYSGTPPQPSGNFSQPVNQAPVIINNTVVQKSNGAGIAGFVLALICALFSWTPGINWILWILGLIFSLVGVFRKPKGLAIAGLVISFIDIIIIIALISAVGSMFAFLT